jgi:hypothetical protein
MRNRATSKPDAAVPAESWFVNLISEAHIAFRRRRHASADTLVEIAVERAAWGKLARRCAAAPWKE